MSQASTYVLVAVFEGTMNMRVEVPYDEANAFFTLLRSYNDMEAGKVHRFLAEIDRIIPKAKYPDGGGRPNPNNGNRTYKISVGRESSPVLYIKRYIHSHNEPLSEEQIRLIKQAARDAKADEIDYKIEDTGTPGFIARIEEFRFWWD